jgi:hypothetical protein
MSISQIVLDTLENEIRTSKINIFTHHLKSVIAKNDKTGSSFSIVHFLLKYQIKYPDFFVKFSKYLQNTTQKDDPILLYISGIGISKDYVKAFSYFSLSDQLEYPRAICSVGYCYDVGQGIAQDMKKAIELYQKSADMGNSQAISNLANCYHHGESVPRNMLKAIEMY